MTSAAIAEYGDGYYLKLELGTYEVTISSMTLDMYVSAGYGELGVKEGDEWVTDGVYYEVSSETVSSSNGTVHYVTVLYLPVSEITNTYSVAMYLDSSMAGVQFGGSNEESYTGTLTLGIE